MSRRWKLYNLKQFKLHSFTLANCPKLMERNNTDTLWVVIKIVLGSGIQSVIQQEIVFKQTCRSKFPESVICWCSSFIKRVQSTTSAIMVGAGVSIETYFGKEITKEITKNMVNSTICEYTTMATQQWLYNIHSWRSTSHNWPVQEIITLCWVTGMLFTFSYCIFMHLCTYSTWGEPAVVGQ